jgi:LysR family transcriptional regulator, transcriptional activator of nhaA
MNYKHLYYFWVVAKQGGFARASEYLDVAIQTISTQVRELERDLGYQLLKPSGRTVEMTQGGQVAFKLAEDIFQIGQRLPQAVKQAQDQSVLTLSVGLCDGISKLTVHSLLDEVLATPNIRLLCHEGEFDQLIGELALHKLDIVFAGLPEPRNPNLRLFSQRLSVSPIRWYGPKDMVASSKGVAFPDCLRSLPVLLPTHHAPARLAIDHWFESLGFVPKIVGEFEDSALLSLFSAKGYGVFPLAQLAEQDVKLFNGLNFLGETPLFEETFGIYTKRAKEHPLIKKILLKKLN